MGRLEAARKHIARAWLVGATAPQTRLVFDMASGNLRFEHFLSTAFPSIDFEFHAVDNCAALAEHGQNDRIACRFRQCDILDTLVSSNAKIPECPLCDLSVSFGFMHHVPSAYLRHRVFEALIEHARVGGLIVLSFWQFMNDTRLAAKALKQTRRLPWISTYRSLSQMTTSLDGNPTPLRCATVTTLTNARSTSL